MKKLINAHELKIKIYKYDNWEYSFINRFWEEIFDKDRVFIETLALSDSLAMIEMCTINSIEKQS